MNERIHSRLAGRARQILADNSVGDFTKPAPQLYPHQWSWDSAFVAIGYAHYDQARAENELRHLFAGQWGSGLVPHIVFNPSASGYFPGPDAWRTETHTPAGQSTSGAIQPPIHATAALRVFRHAADRDRALRFLRELLPRLEAWHAYLYRERDPDGEGLVYVRHPWESGQDNSPIWDAILQRMQLQPEQVPAYRRVDTTHVDTADRPSDADYDRYIFLVQLFADNDYDETPTANDVIPHKHALLGQHRPLPGHDWRAGHGLFLDARHRAQATAASYGG